MATSDIVRKLNIMIADECAFNQEKDVVYFMVQLRKLIEREGALSRHKSVKFYCDWAVHPQKDRNHSDIAPIYEQIYRQCAREYNGLANDNDQDDILSLLQFKSLQRDLRPLLKRYELNDAVVEKLWIQFTKKLLGVLKDQPLAKPSKDIDEIIITSAAGNEFTIKITFVTPIKDTSGRKRTNFKYGLGYIA